MRAMFRPLSLFVGLRYTGARSRSSFVSVITVISAAGLMLGVAVLITVLSVMNGFERELQTRILGMVTHVSVHGREPVQDWEALAEEVSRHPQVIAAAPFVELQGMLSHGGEVAGLMVNGVDPEPERDVSIVGEHMWQGDMESLTPGGFNMVIGYGLARQLGVGIGDKVVLVLPEASLSPAGVTPRFRRFDVTGIFRVRAEVDSLLAYVHVEDAARMARQTGAVEGVRLKISDLFASRHVAWDLQQQLGSDYYMTDWTRSHGSLFQAIRMEKTMMTPLPARHSPSNATAPKESQKPLSSTAMGSCHDTAASAMSNTRGKGTAWREASAARPTTVMIRARRAGNPNPANTA